jgi:hypothetical protein
MKIGTLLLLLVIPFSITMSSCNLKGSAPELALEFSATVSSSTPVPVSKIKIDYTISNISSFDLKNCALEFRLYTNNALTSYKDHYWTPGHDLSSGESFSGELTIDLTPDSVYDILIIGAGPDNPPG